MSRPLRLEFPGSLWHITARGNERRNIYADDSDRRTFLELLGRCVERFKWILTAYVLMPNHYHIVVQLIENTLSRGMKWLNGNYSLAFNRRHSRVGHLFQGRFKGLLVDKEAYSLEVLRYVVLNPVRAGIAMRPEQYRWSSHRALLGLAPAPQWLAVDDALAQFGPNRAIARPAYRAFVNDGIKNGRCPWDDLVGQIYLGGEAWSERIQDELTLKLRSDEHPRSQRLARLPAMPDVIAAVAEVWKTDEDHIRYGRGGIPRMVAAWVACDALLTSREIAAGLRIRSAGHITKLIRECDRTLDQSSALRDSVDRCISTLCGEKEKAKL